MVTAYQGQEISAQHDQPGLEVVDLEEASRQLDMAAHDIAVASGCIGLGDLDEAHTNVITARATAAAAEEILRVALAGGLGVPR